MLSSDLLCPRSVAVNWAIADGRTNWLEVSSAIP